MGPPSRFPPEWQNNPSWRSNRRRRPSSLIFPLILVVAGLILLLNNLGVVPWSIWISLAQLWPILLILLGIDLLFGRTHAWLGIGITALMLALVVGAAFWMTVGGFTPSYASSATTQKSATIPLNGATAANLTINFPAGQLEVGALPDGSPSLAEGVASVPSGMSFSSTSKVENGTATATLGIEGSSHRWPFFGGGSWSGLTLNALLNPRAAESLQVNLGAGSSKLDLTNLPVRELTVNDGAGQIEVRFPANAGTTTADIHNGAGRLTLVVPPGVGAYIHTNNGLVNVNLPRDRFQSVSDGYQTADYGTAANRVDITLHVGAGQVDVE